MIVTLKTSNVPTLDQIRAFLDGSQPFELHIPDREQAYAFIADTLRGLRYSRLKKPDKGLVRRYLIKVSGFSRQQLTRLIAQHRRQGRLEDHRKKPPAKPFAKRYTPDDILTLAELDALHGTLSGPATKKLCERAFRVFGDRRYERLATISNGHLYNLRQSKPYQRQRVAVSKTRPTTVNIGDRRKPRPQGQPGYLRVDSVHQGDLDGIKGLYLINAIDEVSQFQFVAAVERISERFLLPLLERLILAFPFIIRAFHADNGSEYINHRVAALLNKLHIKEFTKSRARHSNDNALVESKNGSIVRKQLGYSHIPGRYASQVNDFTLNVLSPYLNFHRPCFFPEEAVDDKGRITKCYRYELMMTPYEKLKSLPNAGTFLKPGVSFQQLDATALKQSDNEAARLLNQARKELFQSINLSQINAA
jgi:transposase InsO family protein